MIYPQQIRAMEKCLENFQEQEWGNLLAPMQSGKTTTFKLIACEMLRRDRVGRVVIFTGNRETGLRDQCKEMEEFKDDYREYLREVHHLAATEANKACTEVVKKIEIVWGGQLKHHIPNQDKFTLYIWEESHYAQSNKQEVDKFCKRCGIHPAGYVIDGILLSVSATPFSELADRYHLEQPKFVVRLEMGERYRSVKKIRDSGRIRAYHPSVVQTITEGYVLIRATKQEEAKINTNGFKVIYYDTKHPRFVLDDLLAQRPEQKTIIIIKGMLRMGRVLKHKEFITAVIETSSGRTDTLLQSLLGRVCGYDSPEITVYINIDPKEINKFIELYEGDLSSIPTKAMNVVPPKTRTPIQPIRISLGDDPEASLSRHVLDTPWEHQNDQRTMLVAQPIIFKIAAAANKMPSDRTTEEKEFAKHWKLHESGATYNAAIPLVEEAWRTHKKQCEFGSGAGASATTDEVIVWKTERYLYLTMQVVIDTVPQTNNREIFGQKPITGNAQFPFPSTTRTDAAELERVLFAMVETSRELGVPILNSNGGEHIVLKPEVFAHLEILKRTWTHTTLSYKKVGKKGPTGFTDVRLSMITWTPPTAN